MAKVSINMSKLTSLAKKGLKQPQAAKELGISTGQLDMLTWGKALLAAGKLDKIASTPKAVKAARDGGMRWEYIAAASDNTVGAVKKLYAEAGGDPAASYIGRGRKPNGNGESTPAADKPKRGPAAGAGKPAAGGRKGGKPAATPATPARTRAERARKTGNPS